MQFYGVSFTRRYKQEVLDTQSLPAIDQTAYMDA